MEGLMKYFVVNNGWVLNLQGKLWGMLIRSIQNNLIICFKNDDFEKSFKGVRFLDGKIFRCLQRKLFYYLGMWIENVNKIIWFKYLASFW